MVCIHSEFKLVLYRCIDSIISLIKCANDLITESDINYLLCAVLPLTVELYIELQAVLQNRTRVCSRSTKDILMSPNVPTVEQRLNRHRHVCQDIAGLPATLLS